MSQKLSVTPAIQGKKHRVHQWINTATAEPLFGVQCNVAYGQWSHVVVGTNVALFVDREEAAKLARQWSSTSTLKGDRE